MTTLHVPHSSSASVVANCTIHFTRVALAAAVVGAIWAVLRTLLQLLFIILDYLRVESLSAMVAVFGLVLLAFVMAFMGGGYASARYITPRSLLHAAAAGFLGMLAWTQLGGEALGAPWMSWSVAAALSTAGAHLANSKAVAA